jgi:SET domain-containing protein
MAKIPHNTHPLVKAKKSGIHGFGGYARKPIKKGKRIIEYTGPLISKEDAALELKEQNEYVFTLNEDEDIDGSVLWNLARYLNHSCDPNCESEIKKGRVWIYATRSIEKGEELTYNYGYELDGFEDRPCCCGADCCQGYMVGDEHFKTLKKRLNMKKKATS